ncbi:MULTISPECIES: hypothetical protein [Levilactobacillus]|uniref:hypothetical protein n=1 Tax=Levilactobacillus TaxID=2767886 RepID=UPI001CED4ED3|nr:MULTISPECIES: hypothetical protein [Levilactobacillus]
MRWNYLIMMVATAQAHIPPHYFFGYKLTEWASIATLVVAVAGAIVWLVNTAIVKPLKVSIDTLSQKVEGIGGNADVVHKEHDRRLDEHEVHLARHDEEIKTLFERSGGNSK